MLRDLLLSGVLGAGCAGVGTYVLHRTLWKSSNAQAKRIEALASDPSEVAVIPTSSAFSARRDPPVSEKFTPSCFIRMFSGPICLLIAARPKPSISSVSNIVSHWLRWRTGLVGR